MTPELQSALEWGENGFLGPHHDGVILAKAFRQSESRAKRTSEALGEMTFVAEHLLQCSEGPCDSNCKRKARDMVREALARIKDLTQEAGK